MTSRRTRRLQACAAAFAAAVAWSAAPAAVAQVPKPISVSPPAGAPMSFADLIDRVSPAVVSVSVTTEIHSQNQARRFNPFRGLPGFDEFDDQFEDDGDDSGSPETDEEGRALGSGFFISPQGYIVTNNHVVEDAREVVVILKDGDELEAEIVGTDEQTDLAVLKVKKSGSYPYVQFAAKARPRVGDWVVAVGNPFGLGGTATAGIVSADGRKLNNASYNDFIQVDAPINRGNSGGPTFNLKGEVIGVNTAIFSESGGSVGIGFAIEAAAAKKITDALIKDGKVERGWLGVVVQSLDDGHVNAWGLKSKKGALVSQLTAGGPAEAAGLKREDIILSVNDEEVDDHRDLTRKVGGLIAGSRNSFKVLRDGKEQTIWVTIARRTENPTALEPNPLRDEFDIPKTSADDVEVLGGTVRSLTAEQSKAFAVPEGEGLLVVTVKNHGELVDAAILPGDALLSANKVTLKTPKDLLDTLESAKAEGKENVVLLVSCGDRRRCGDATFFRAVPLK
ncbi:MAG: Do family serine endopeptidase [Hyphomonadaceae bacterium]